MRLQGLLRWAGRGLAACSALLPFTGLIPPGGAAAWALLALSVPRLVALHKILSLCYNKIEKMERGSTL